jgi:hypothetical protein
MTPDPHPVLIYGTRVEDIGRHPRALSYDLSGGRMKWNTYRLCYTKAPVYMIELQKAFALGKKFPARLFIVDISVAFEEVPVETVLLLYEMEDAPANVILPKDWRNIYLFLQEDLQLN